MSEAVNKDLDYYMNLDWTLIEGTDLDFNGNPLSLYRNQKKFQVLLFVLRPEKKHLRITKNSFVFLLCLC